MLYQSALGQVSMQDDRDGPYRPQVTGAESGLGVRWRLALTSGVPVESSGVFFLKSPPARDPQTLLSDLRRRRLSSRSSPLAPATVRPRCRCPMLPPSPFLAPSCFRLHLANMMSCHHNCWLHRALRGFRPRWCFKLGSWIEFEVHKV